MADPLLNPLLDLKDSYQEDKTVEEMFLPQLVEALEKPVHRRPKPMAWAKKYFPHYYQVKPSTLHFEIEKDIIYLTKNRGVKIDEIDPRGCGKSTYWSFIFPLYNICEELEKYILLIADVQDQSKKYLKAIKDELVENDKLAEDYPHVCGRGPTWNKTGIITKNGIAVDALGMKSKIRGRKHGPHRPSSIVMDDPENDDHIYSPDRRAKSRDTLHKDVEKAGNKKTNIILCGTALHRDCLVLNTQKRPGWKSRLTKSIIKWPEDMQLWHQWKDILCKPGDENRDENALKFYKKNKAAMNKGAKVIWPEWEPLYELMVQWASDIVSFYTEKQNKPINPEACEWPPEYFDYEGFWFEEWPKEYKLRVIAVDPSKGKESKKGDYSSICLLQAGIDGYFYVDFDMARRPVEVISEAIADHYMEFGATAIPIEVNQFQELMLEPTERAGLKRGVTLPLVDIVNTVKKEIRIRRIGPLLCKKWLRFKRTPGTDIAVDQMRDFSNGDHDDGPDSLEMALRVANDHLRERPIINII